MRGTIYTLGHLCAPRVGPIASMYKDPLLSGPRFLFRMIPYSHADIFGYHWRPRHSQKPTSPYSLSTNHHSHINYSLDDKIQESRPLPVHPTTETSGHPLRTLTVQAPDVRFWHGITIMAQPGGRQPAMTTPRGPGVNLNGTSTFSASLR